MSTHPLLARADAGESLRGLAVAVAAPSLVEFGGWAGFDWTFIDVHQAAIDAATCESMLRAAERSGMTAFVRLPRAAPELISSYLDMGAVGVVVPHMDTAELAAAAVEQARFRPEGRRGSNMAARAARYGLVGSAADYQARFNRESVLIGMIEAKAAVDNLPAILEVRGIDLFMLGLMDLSESLGVPGQWDHPDVTKAVDEVVGRVRAAGRHVCVPTMDLDRAPGSVRELRERGVHFTVVSVYQLLSAACGRFLAPAP
jgi:4-hydroxy-2-oxoheptanedioate aldolase